MSDNNQPDRRTTEYHVSEKTIHGMSNSIHENGMQLRELRGKLGEMERGLRDNTNVTVQLENKFNQMDKDLKANTDLNLKMAETLKRIDANTSEVVTSYTNFQGFTKTVKWAAVTITPIVTFIVWAKHSFTNLWPFK